MTMHNWTTPCLADHGDALRRTLGGRTTNTAEFVNVANTLTLSGPEETISWTLVGGKVTSQDD